MTQRVVNYTYGTGNPVLPDGSIDVRDGIDNLQSFDILMNAPEDTYNQRDGEVVRTVSGMSNEFDSMIVDMNSEFDGQIINMGFTRIGTFAAGATLTNPRQTILWDIADGGDGQEYGWSGAFPKVVPATSTPASTGGISVGAWMSRFDPELRIQVREALRRSYAEAGFIVTGPFVVGAHVTSANDVLIDEVTGGGYAFTGAYPHTVASGETPASAGWTDRSLTALRFDLADPAKGDSLIAVQQPFVGSAPRTQHDKNKDVINVADFTGFDPSGNTDSSAAFNAALQAAKLNDFAANTVVIPAGVFLVKDVNLDSPVNLIGAGKLNTTFRPVADGDVCFKMTSTFGRISGISIQSNEGPSSNSTGISIENSLNTVDDCSFAFLKHCIFSGRGLSAAELDIRHNRFAASDYGVALLGGQINTRFLMNTYAGCKHGLLIAEDLSMGVSGTTEGIKIVGDLFYACGDSATNASGIEIVGTRWTWFDDVMVDLSAGVAVTLSDAKYVKMTNGYYSSNASINKSCVEVKGNCVDFHADGVKFSDSREFGLKLSKVGSAFPGRAILANCVFQFNDIDAAQQGDILIDSVPGVSAVNCTFTANKPTGIAVLGNESDISTLTCSRCNFYGQVLIGNPASCRFYSYDSPTHPDKQQGVVTIPNGAAFIDIPKTTVSLVGAGSALVFATAANATVALSCGVVGSSVKITRAGTAGDLLVQYQSYLNQ